jgi:hypothetical protein
MIFCAFEGPGGSAKKLLRERCFCASPGMKIGTIDATSFALNAISLVSPSKNPLLKSTFSSSGMRLSPSWIMCPPREFRYPCRELRCPDFAIF